MLSLRDTSPFQASTPGSRRRRALGCFAAAAGIHMLILVVVLLAAAAPAPAPETPRAKEPIRFVRVESPPQRAKVDDPLEYAASPQKGSTSDASAAQSRVAPSPQRVSGASLQRALNLYQQGLQAPSYVLEDLSPQLLSRIVDAGLGRVVVGEPPFSRNTLEMTNWSASGPTDAIPLEGTDWKSGLAARVLRLPGPLLDRLFVSMPVAGERSSQTGYLLVSRALDLLILAAQLEACESNGLPLERVRHTVGRLRFTGSAFDRFAVERLELIDGSFRAPAGS